MTKSTEQTPDHAKHVVIVGGGFAGLNCARKLAANPNVRITLLDKNNYQQFQPLLYQVATAILAPSNIAFNLRHALTNHANVDVKMTEVVSVVHPQRHPRAAKLTRSLEDSGDVVAGGINWSIWSTVHRSLNEVSSA